MYMNLQPNVNTWKCHNPQWEFLGDFFFFFFAGGGENILFHCKRRHHGGRGCSSSCSDKQESVGSRSQMEAESLRFQGKVNRSFFKQTAVQMSKAITLQLKIKMSPGRGQRPKKDPRTDHKVVIHTLR